MAHYATNRFNYWGQLGILTAFCGAGLVIGGLASMVPLMGKANFFNLKGISATQIMDSILKPENATALRWSQFIATVGIFFLPAFLYARVCHIKAFKHLGFKKDLDIKQILVVLFIMLAALPLVGALGQYTEMLPWSKATLVQFKEAEDTYNKQVAVIARMDNFTDYIISIVVIALLPALFEEILFRGAIQNLLSRWFKRPILAIILTAIVFSAVHGSYLGFLSRFALGFLLGWVYYRTGNIWLNIIGHFANNALGVTSLYMASKPGEKINPSSIDEHFPLWAALLSVAAVVGLLILFNKVAKKSIDHPGEEVLIPGYNFSNPFINEIESSANKHQS